MAKKKKGLLETLQALSDLAEWTGLEPATPGVTGRYSNQLNYHSYVFRFSWWVLRGSNSRPTPCKGDALPAELSTPKGHVLAYPRTFETSLETSFKPTAGRPRKAC